MWQTIGLTAGPISFATCSSVSFLRPQITTVAPSRTNTSAIERPMPRLAPVTIATLFFSMMYVARISVTYGNENVAGKGVVRTGRHGVGGSRPTGTESGTGAREESRRRAELLRHPAD